MIGDLAELDRIFMNTHGEEMETAVSIVFQYVYKLVNNSWRL